ncbi:MAG: L-aspartate oxidase [Hyphomicrobium sp.]|nr:MAG: L-aspartate oxidase [Hyphomicrobium sp.]
MATQRKIDAKSKATRKPKHARRAEGDIIVIGAGLAGLFTALKLAPLAVTVIAAAPLGEGASSVWAQGGISAAVGDGDTPAKHAADTIAAGAGIVDDRIALIVAAEAPDRIRDLLAYGVPFDRDLEGHFVLSKEAAHSEKRVVRVSGDRAGAAIMQSLIAAVRQTPSIRLLEGYEAEELIMRNGRVSGLRLIRSAARGNGTWELIPASAVVLATGGIGALYAVTTNPAYARGEAIAFAARAGAAIADAEFVQFHPTALDVGLDPAPLVTEALRGEGAILVNRHGDRFMTCIHPDAELAPRDIVARGVFAEIAAKRGAFLDCRKAIGDRFKDAYPTVYAHCQAAGIDPARDLIPVAPAVHYHMGGIATDASGRTSVDGLWAAGEVASTGLHGANRLASNSLLEAVVLGARVAADIAANTPPTHSRHMSEPQRIPGVRPAGPASRAAALARLRATMTDHVGVVRTAAGLKTALSVLAEIERAANGDTVLANMALAARFIATAALKREESRGGHFRSDFPKAKPALRMRSYLTLPDLAVLPEEPKEKALQSPTSTASLH